MTRYGIDALTAIRRGDLAESDARALLDRLTVMRIRLLVATDVSRVQR